MQVRITVTATVKAYAIFIDRNRLRVSRRPVTVELEPGEHGLSWMAPGDPGDRIQIRVEAGPQVLREIDDRVAAGDAVAAGTVRFSVGDPEFLIGGGKK